MKRILSHLCMALCLTIVGTGIFGAASVLSADQNCQDMKQLLNELSQEVDDADKRMVAHPNFIKELRKLVDKYRAKLRDTFINETFSDGDFHRNPVWQVMRGTFSITEDRRLYSHADSYYKEEQQQEPERKKEAFEIIIGEILKPREGDDQEEPASDRERVEEEAAVRTKATISPDYEVDMTVVSDSTWGNMEIVLLGGNNLNARYRLRYYPSPSQDRPIEIIRERNGRQYMIDSATKYPDLDDGRTHRIQWSRDTGGKMKVLVDGQEIISTVEVYYRDKFKGIELVNHGGTYEWGPIRVMQAEKTAP